MRSVATGHRAPATRKAVTPTYTPRVLPEYASRLADRRARENALATRDRTIATARLIAIALAILLLFLAVVTKGMPQWLWIPPFVAFIVLIVIHDKTLTARRRAATAVAFYERAVERTTDAWQGKGFGGQQFAEEHHPYANDLDLFGSGSLYELLCIAVTRAGRAKLARWLKEPSGDAVEIAERQAAAAELRDRVDLREELAIVAAEVSGDVERAELERWGEAPPLVAAPWERIGTIVLPAVTIAALVLGLAQGIWSPLIVFVIAERLFARRMRPRVEALTAAAERAEPALALLSRILERLERERFTAPRNVALVRALERAGEPASKQIDRLRRLVALLEARRNQFFIPIAGLLLWSENLAFFVERWRRESGVDIRRWIDAAGELETLSSLASFAYEHPEFATPEIVSEGPLFDARELGHPLIPAARRVANDLRLDPAQRLLVISGSNMSGKSTFQRSTGVAAVLALAGGVVCARSLRIAPLSLGASIRINDSLQEGSSRFYAEILRIREILDLAASPTPLLFLLDEILHGTNSHDRRIGAEAVVRALVSRGAIGLVSTHDLALADIADSLAPAAQNVHFEDEMVDGRIVFDYRMRPGVVRKSNALALMRAVGIEV
jgi:hypothetical protein